MLIHVTQPKINNFERQIIVQQQILRFEISVAHSALVNIFDTGYELEIKLASLFFRESGVPYDVVEELTPIAVLHDHVELLLCLNDLIELNDVRMPYLLEDLDFSRYALYVLLVVNFVLFQDFNSNLKG